MSRTAGLVMVNTGNGKGKTTATLVHPNRGLPPFGLTLTELAGRF